LHALLYDIHGNLPALEAVLEDARAAGAERFMLGGDYALFGARPAETVDRLRELEATWIRGNTDRWVAGDLSDAPDGELVRGSIAHCRDALGARASELGALAPNTRLGGVLFCHASPSSDMQSFPPMAADTDRRLLEGVDDQTVVFGHTHLQFKRESASTLLVNPGSVGMPFDGDRRAAYAIWRDGGEIELRRVKYDVDGYVDELRSGLSGALGGAIETLARRLEQAAFVD
jgi:predicted phosphodiesterase